MQNYSFAERTIHKIGEKMNPILGPIRRKKLNNTDFTIIANNCWAGVCYEWFNMPKQSPTVGMYFFPDEYINFLTNLKSLLALDFEVVSAQESKYYNELKKRGQDNVMIGKLGNVEMTLLHYHDKNIAMEKWKRRVDRINWNNMIYKFSYMNGCRDEHVHAFEKLKKTMPKNFRGEVKTILFVPREFSEYDDSYVIHPNESGQIENDTFYWNKYCDVTQIINR